MKIPTSNGIIQLWNNFLEKLKAKNVSFNGEASILDATNVQDAIDELKLYIDEECRKIMEDRLGNCHLKYEEGKFYIGRDTVEEEL